MKILNVLKSKYCWLVILISIGLSYFLVLKNINQFTNTYVIIFALIYATLFSISNACIIKDIVNRFTNKVKRNEKLTFKQILGISGSILGYGALQTCTVGYACTTPILLSILPTSFSTLFLHHGIWLLIASDILLLFSIYRMNCFKS